MTRPGMLTAAKERRILFVTYSTTPKLDSMGHIYQLVAPKAQIVLPAYGTFGEILYNKLFSYELEHALVIPIRPQHIRDAASDHGKKGRADDKSPCRRTPHSERGQTSKGGVISGEAEGDTAIAALHCDTAITFDDFPAEIHRLIFSQIEDLVDLISLGVTSQYYWTIARECLEVYANSFMGRLAGENIVLVADEVYPNYYPPDLFTPEERSALQGKLAPATDDSDDEADRPFTLYHFTDPRVSTVIKTPLSPDYPIRKLMIKFLARYPLQASLPRAVRSQLMDIGREIVSPNQQWILRNLTTKQFVRAEAIAVKPEFINGPFNRGWGFAEVLLSRICWPKGAPHARTVWAGHRFDIITHIRHVNETKDGEGWEDVSDQVAAEMESEYGLDWREEFCTMHGDDDHEGKASSYLPWEKVFAGRLSFYS